MRLINALLIVGLAVGKNVVYLQLVIAFVVCILNYTLMR